MLLIESLVVLGVDTLEIVTISQFFRFVTLSPDLKRYIQLVQPAHHTSPLHRTIFHLSS